MNAKTSLAAALSVLAFGSVAVAADLPRRATAPAPYVAQGVPVQPLTEWLQVMTEEVQRKEEAARAAVAESERRR
jgi:hypothetical protein